MGDIWAIVLAAGESKRMNSPKMLLPVNGKSMIEKVVENISESRVDKTMVVTGAYSDEINKIIGSLPVTVCHNENYSDGMLSSVKCAFRAISEKAAAVMVFPGDKPWITPDVVNSLIESYRHEKKGIVIPVYLNRRGHPVLIDLKYRNEVAILDPDEGLRSLAGLFPDDVMEVNTDTPGILKDIDTYEDYVRSINQKP